MFDKLEDQMCEFSIDNIRSASTGSPDRVDALVWGLSEVFEKIAGRKRLFKGSNQKPQDGTEWSVDSHYDNNPQGWMC
jgi:hypothetical protein